MFNWYRIFKLTEFLDTMLVSRVYTLELENIGIKDVLVTNGKTVSITYEDVMLPLNLNGKNPFIFEGKAIYLKPETQDVYLGFPIT